MHSPGKRRRQSKISLEAGLESVVELIKDGDLDIYQKAELLRERV